MSILLFVYHSLRSIINCNDIFLLIFALLQVLCPLNANEGVSGVRLQHHQVLCCFAKSMLRYGAGNDDHEQVDDDSTDDIPEMNNDHDTVDFNRRHQLLNSFRS